MQLNIPTNVHNNHNNDVFTLIIQEIRQLHTKIRHIRESIQLSTNIAQPPIWRDNCLNATSNIVHTWKTIIAHYDPFPELLLQSNDINHPLHRENELCKDTACQVFGLIQLCLQCGPLKGSNAGYFKRCGSEVAKLAKSFLERCLNVNDDNAYRAGLDGNEENGELGFGRNFDYILNDLRFSVKQKEMIEKWIKSAEKAIIANKAPSKFALKLQSTVNSKGTNKRK